jgi:hypothetical protein
VQVVAHAGAAPLSAASVIDAFLNVLDANVEWVLVPHSNAGLFAPAVARTRRVGGVVYVDSRLPETDVCPMRPPGSLGFLADKVDSSGLLPPWNLWWDGDLSHLFPTRAVQRVCEAEMRRLPVSYFEDCIDGTGWDEFPSAYLAFGEAYAAERDRAVAAGWPTVTMKDAEHLQMLMDPDGVVSQIETLMAALGITADNR